MATNKYRFHTHKLQLIWELTVEITLQFTVYYIHLKPVLSKCYDRTNRQMLRLKNNYRFSINTYQPSAIVALCSIVKLNSSLVSIVSWTINKDSIILSISCHMLKHNISTNYTNFEIQLSCNTFLVIIFIFLNITGIWCVEWCP